MFVSGCEVPLRATRTHRRGRADAGGGGTILLMPAWRVGARLGIKTVTIFPGNGALGLPGLHSTYGLFDAATGVPLAQLDGNEITSRRTAAASALAASFLARADARRLLILGTGRVAALLAEAMRARPADRRGRGLEPPAAAAANGSRASCARPASPPRAAPISNPPCASADIVSCATLSTAAAGARRLVAAGHAPRPDRQLHAADARGGCRVLHARPRLRRHRRSAGQVGRRARAIAARRVRRGAGARHARRAVRRHAPGPARRRRRTLFKAVGTALEDLAAAELVFDAVRRESLSSGG